MKIRHDIPSHHNIYNYEKTTVNILFNSLWLNIPS